MATTELLKLIRHASGSTASIPPVANDNLEKIDDAFGELVLYGILADRPADPGEAVSVYYVSDVQGMIAYIWDDTNTVWIDVPVTTTNTGYGTTAEIPATANVGDIFTPSDQPDIVFYVSDGAAWIPIAGGSSGGGGGVPALTKAIPDPMTDEYIAQFMDQYCSQVRRSDFQRMWPATYGIVGPPTIGTLYVEGHMVLHQNGLVYFIDSINKNIVSLDPEKSENVMIAATTFDPYEQSRGGISGSGEIVFTLWDNTTTHRIIRVDPSDNSYVVEIYSLVTNKDIAQSVISTNDVGGVLIHFQNYIINVNPNVRTELPTRCDYSCDLGNGKVMFAPYLSDDPFYIYDKVTYAITTIASPGAGSMRHSGVHIKGNRVVWIPSQLRFVTDLIWVYNYVDDTWQNSVPRDFQNSPGGAISGHTTLYGWPCLLPSGEVWIQGDGKYDNIIFDPDTFIVSEYETFNMTPIDYGSRSQNIMLSSGKMLSGSMIGNNERAFPSLVDFGFAPINGAMTGHHLINH